VRTIFRLICLVFMLGGWALAALALHVVRTPDKIAVIPKNRLGVNDTYVDARTWSLADVPDHTAVVQRIIGTGHADVLAYLTDSKSKASAEAQLTAALKEPPAKHAAGPSTAAAPAVPPAGSITITIPLGN